MGEIFRAKRRYGLLPILILSFPNLFFGAVDGGEGFSIERARVAAVEGFDGRPDQVVCAGEATLFEACFDQLFDFGAESHHNTL